MKKLFYLLGVCLFFFLGKTPAQEQRTNLPSVYINTENNASITSKTDYIYSTLTYVDGDSVAVYDSVSIRGRGNSTWNFAKKPYRIKFKQKEKFLGKGFANAKKWTLLANHADKTLIRNAVAAEIGRYMELPFNAAARFMDLTLNGSFLGNYQISDQVDVRKNRVHIEEQDYPLEEGADISGGYLVEIDGFGASEPVHFRTKKNLLVTVKYPDSDEIVPAQTNYIKNYLQEFEDILFSENYKDPEMGYRTYVDSATLVNWYLATELTGNVDGFWSTYVYKNREDPKLYFGPLWDYDIAFNNCNRVGEVTNSLMMDKGFGSDLTKVWMKRMWTDEWFLKAISSRWNLLVESGMKEHLLSYIDDLGSELQRSQALNYADRRNGGAGWKINSRVYNEIVLFSTYQGGIDYLKDFIDQHTDFLTTTFASLVDGEPEPEPEPSEPFVPDEDFYYRILNKGTTTLLDVSDSSRLSDARIVMWSADYDRISQQWDLVKIDDEYVRVVNRQSQLAMTDVATYSDGSYVIGSPMVQLPVDELNDRQLWKLIPVNTGDLYVFENAQTNLIMNNSGGNANDGNSVISYTNDDRNTTSNNRQWYVEKYEMKPEDPEPDPEGLDDARETHYAVYYNPETQEIRFDADDMDLIDLEARIYSSTGKEMLRFHSSAVINVSDLPVGIYILRWEKEGKVQNVKFVKSK